MSSINGVRIDDPAKFNTAKAFGYVTGLYYRSPYFIGGDTGVALSANIIYYVPFPILATKTFDRIGVRVGTAVDTKKLRFGIYTGSESTWRPTTLFLDAGEATMSGTGAQDAEITISTTLTGGVVYWVVVTSDDTPTVNHVPVTYDINCGGANLSQTRPYCHYRQTATYGVLPTVGTLTASNNAGPSIQLRAA